MGVANSQDKIIMKLKELDKKEFEINKQLKTLQGQLNEMIPEDEQVKLNELLELNTEARMVGLNDPLPVSEFIQQQLAFNPSAPVIVAEGIAVNPKKNQLEEDEDAQNGEMLNNNNINNVVQGSKMYNNQQDPSPLQSEYQEQDGLQKNNKFQQIDDIEQLEDFQQNDNDYQQQEDPYLQNDDYQQQQDPYLQNDDYYQQDQYDQQNNNYYQQDQQDQYNQQNDDDYQQDPYQQQEQYQDDLNQNDSMDQEHNLQNGYMKQQNNDEWADNVGENEWDEGNTVNQMN